MASGILCRPNSPGLASHPQGIQGKGQYSCLTLPGRLQSHLTLENSFTLHMTSVSIASGVHHCFWQPNGKARLDMPQTIPPSCVETWKQYFLPFPQFTYCWKIFIGIFLFFFNSTCLICHIHLDFGNPSQSLLSIQCLHVWAALTYTISLYTPLLTFHDAAHFDSQ